MLWRGYVRYSERRRFFVWAEVRISAEVSRVIAAQPIAAREVIREEQLRLETSRGFPFDDSVAGSIEEVAGSVSLRSIREDSPVPTQMLRAPLHVKQGDTVEVQVRNGATMIRAQALAEAGGREGESILLRNPKSGQTFRAEVIGPKKVLVKLSGK